MEGRTVPAFSAPIFHYGHWVRIVDLRIENFRGIARFEVRLHSLVYDPLGHQHDYSYDVDGNVLQYGSGTGSTIANATYNSQDNPLTLTDPTGVSSSIGYTDSSHPYYPSYFQIFRDSLRSFRNYRSAKSQFCHSPSSGLPPWHPSRLPRLTSRALYSVFYFRPRSRASTSGSHQW